MAGTKPSLGLTVATTVGLVSPTWTSWSVTVALTGMSKERHWLGGLFHAMVPVTALGPMAKKNVLLHEMPSQE